MYREIDIENWNRKEQYALFKDYQSPYFNICTTLDVTEILEYTRSNELSFFLAYLFASQKAANQVEAFRYRFKDQAVIAYDIVHARCVILNDDESFSFCQFDYRDDFSGFSRDSLEVLKTNATDRQALDPRRDVEDVIHYSVLPWIDFSSITHSRNDFESAVPKVVFGKYSMKESRMRLPISLEAHHAAMDGIHAHRYLSRFQDILNEPARHLED